MCPKQAVTLQLLHDASKVINLILLEKNKQQLNILFLHCICIEKCLLDYINVIFTNIILVTSA